VTHPVPRVSAKFLLEINGTDLRRDAWEVRRATLASLLRNRSAKHAAPSLPLFSGCTITRKKAAAKKRTAHRRAS
jgi:hypothetical protein